MVSCHPRLALTVSPGPGFAPTGYKAGVDPAVADESYVVATGEARFVCAPPVTESCNRCATVATALIWMLQDGDALGVVALHGFDCARRAADGIARNPIKAMPRSSQRRLGVIVSQEKFPERDLQERPPSVAESFRMRLLDHAPSLNGE